MCCQFWLDQLSEIQTTKYDLNVCQFWLDQLLEIRTTKYDYNGLQNMLNWVPPLFSTFSHFLGSLGTIYTTEAELLILPLFDTAVVYIID